MSMPIQRQSEQFSIFDDGPRYARDKGNNDMPKGLAGLVNSMGPRIQGGLLNTREAANDDPIKYVRRPELVQYQNEHDPLEGITDEQLARHYENEGWNSSNPADWGTSSYSRRRREAGYGRSFSMGDSPYSAGWGPADHHGAGPDGGPRNPPGFEEDYDEEPDDYDVTLENHDPERFIPEDRVDPPREARRGSGRRPFDRAAGARLAKDKDSKCDCWDGYCRVPGTKPCAEGSCKKCDGHREAMIEAGLADEIRGRGIQEPMPWKETDQGWQHPTTGVQVVPHDKTPDLWSMIAPAATKGGGKTRYTQIGVHADPQVLMDHHDWEVGGPSPSWHGKPKWYHRVTSPDLPQFTAANTRGTDDRHVMPGPLVDMPLYEQDPDDYFGRRPYSGPYCPTCNNPVRWVSGPDCNHSILRNAAAPVPQMVPGGHGFLPGHQVLTLWRGEPRGGIVTDLDLPNNKVWVRYQDGQHLPENPGDIQLR